MRYLRTTTIIATTCAVAATLATTTAREQVETVPATSCESLASLVLSNTTITAAVAVDAGAWSTDSHDRQRWIRWCDAAAADRWGVPGHSRRDHADGNLSRRG